MRWSDKGQLDEAIACYQQGHRTRPEVRHGPQQPGHRSGDKGQLDEAIACFSKAIELDPKYRRGPLQPGQCAEGQGPVGRGHRLLQEGHRTRPEARRCPLQPGHAIWLSKGDFDEAIACFSKAIELDPKHAEAHCNLGFALANQGRFGESLAALKRGHELGSKQPGWRYPSAEWVREAEAKAAMERSCPRSSKASSSPATTRNGLALADVCQVKKLHQRSGRPVRRRLRRRPQAGRRPESRAPLQRRLLRHRWPPPARAIPALRQSSTTRSERACASRPSTGSAPTWHCMLSNWTTGKPADRAEVQEAMPHWQQDTDLAGLRDAAALAKLPAEEQKAFTQLWADVAALLKKASGPPSLALLMQQLPEARKALPKDSPQLAGLLAQIGLGLQQEKKWTDAEPLLRECLSIREQTQPDVWSTFNTKSLLGGALLGQKKYADAEPLLLAGYEGMKQREKTIPEQGKIRLREAVERLLQLYEATGKTDEAAKWRKELDAIKAGLKKVQEKPQ